MGFRVKSFFAERIASFLVLTLTTGVTVACTEALQKAPILPQRGVTPLTTLVPIDHFSFTNIPSPQTAGTSFSVTIQAWDAGNKLLTKLNAPIAFTDDTGTLSPTEVTFVAGVAVVSFTITKATGSTRIHSVPDGNMVPLSYSNSFAVNPGVTKQLACTSVPASVTAGTAFTVAFKSQDAYGNDTTTYNSANTVSITNALNGILAPLGTQSIALGTVTVPTTKLSKTGTDTINAYDSASNSVGHCGPFTVNPGPLASISFTSLNPQIACHSFASQIKAYDAWSNLKTDFNGAVTMSTVSGTGTFTAPLSFSNGVADIVTNISKAGADTISAQTVAPDPVVSSSVAVTINPDGPNSISLSTIAAPAACTNQILTVSVVDQCNNVVTSVNTAFSLTVNAGGVSITPSSGTFTNGTFTAGNFQFSGSSGGVVLGASTTIGSATITGTSPTYVVGPSTSYHLEFSNIPATTACTNFPFTVTLKDSCNLLVSSGATANSVVNLSENSGATLTPANATLVNGTVTVAAARVTQSGTGRSITGVTGAVTGTSNVFDTPVTTTPDHISIQNIGAQTACVNFNVQGEMRDACQNIITSYNGAATVTVNAGSLSSTGPGNFNNGVYSFITSVTPANAAETITITTAAPAMNATSNAFNVAANANPYDFNIAISPNVILQDGSESAIIDVSSAIDSCLNPVPNGTVASITLGSPNLTSVTGPATTTVSAGAQFQIKGANTGAVGPTTASVTIGGTLKTVNLTLVTALLFNPLAGQSYKLKTALTNPTMADFTGSGIAYGAGDTTAATNADGNAIVDLVPPEAGWKNMSSELYGGFGSVHVSSASNGLIGSAATYATNISRYIVFGGQDFATPTANYRSNTYFFEANSGVWTDASSGDMCGANLFKTVFGYGSCASSPSPRRDAVLSYMSSSGKVLMFGGWNGTTSLNDTWEFDPVTRTWTQIFPTSTPPRRSGATVFYNTFAGAVFMFGGNDGSTYYNDVWRYSPGSQNWTSVYAGTTKPSARSGTVAAQTADGRVYFFGGKNGSTVYNDTWMFSNLTNTFNQVGGSLGCTTSCPNSPPARAFHIGGFVQLTNDFVVIGGMSSSGSAQNDMWTLDVSIQGVETWNQQTPPLSPDPFTFGTAAQAPSGTAIYFMGGTNSSGNARTDVWKYNGISHSWQQFYVNGETGCGPTSFGSERCSAPPFPRSLSGFATLSSTSVMPAPFTVFGGLVGSTFKRDQWILDPTAATPGWTQKGDIPALDVTNSRVRTNQLAFASSTSKLVRWGGLWNSGCASNDTWEYDPAALSWTQYVGAAGCGCTASCAASPPQPTSESYGLAYASTQDRVVLTGVDANTWEYNPTAHTWTSFAVSSGQRSFFKAVYLASTNRVLAFGGVIGGAVNGETWEYNPAAHTWTQYFPGVTPGARAGYAAAYSPVTGLAYLFGGYDAVNFQYNDIWSYDPATHTWTQVTVGCTSNCSGPAFRRNSEMAYSPQTGCLHVFGGESSPGGINVARGDHWRYCPTGNALGTRTFHQVTYDISSMTAGQIANIKGLNLLFLGGGGGDSGQQAVFNVDFQMYLVGPGSWMDLGPITTNTLAPQSITIPVPVTNYLSGSNQIKLYMTPANPVGQYNGTGLYIDRAQLQVKYH